MPGDRAGVGERRHLVDHGPPARRVVGGGAQSSANGRSRASGPRASSASTSSASRSRWRAISADPVVGLHDVVGGDPLEDGDLALGLGRARQVGVVADERPVVARRTSPSCTAPQNRPIRSLVRFFSAARCRRDPSYAAVASRPTAAGRSSASSSSASDAPGRYHSRTVAHTAARSSEMQVDAPRDDAVLDVVHGVGDVVGEVHHLRLEAPAAAVDARSRTQSKTGRSSS